MERVLRREIARADRGGRGFSLVLFRVKSGPTERTTRLLAEVLLKRARLTDEVGWFSDNYLCAVLTGTPPSGARVFADGVCDAAGHHAPRPLAVVYTYPAASFSEHNGHNGGHGRANGHRFNGDGAFSPLSAAVADLRDKDKDIESETLDGFVQAGFNSELSEPGLPAGSMTELLAYPMPWWKRVIDIIGAIIGLMVLSPILIVAAIAIKVTSCGPVIFRQKRSGLGGRPFMMYKFRTMINGAEARRKELEALNEQDGPAFKLENDPRLTKIGRFLRKTSIDELPQLYNVIKGDMSLVGPRPLPCTESEECLPWQRHRMNVTPGLTCIWQIKGRSRVAFDEWVRMDMAYIGRRSLWKDLQIIFATIPAVLLRKGAK
ncbi:MAG TPA: sugar transferase [Tepidisphaeraceae bacterium]|nr:sugar transferase [Tepidisphaeraceae bacterium]